MRTLQYKYERSFNRTAEVRVSLDVVGFTTDRSVEAQSDIVVALNTVVKHALMEQSLPQDRVILLPTGDGICIALVNVEEPFDVHLRLAIAVVAGVYGHSSTEQSSQRRFEVRIGINANIDNLVTDINGNRNVAGAGINMAARVMSLADGNQVFVSAAVHDVLKYREAYESAFVAYEGIVKHDVPLPVFHFVGACERLNKRVPKVFQPRIRLVPRMPDDTAAYIVVAHTYQQFILAESEDGFESAGMLWLWYRGQDALAQRKRSRLKSPTFGRMDMRMLGRRSRSSTTSRLILL